MKLKLRVFPCHVDHCPYDAYKTEPEECGCGNAETDSDYDGTPDCNGADYIDIQNVWQENSTSCSFLATISMRRHEYSEL